jgi:hypothetical protein
MVIEDMLRFVDGLCAAAEADGDDMTALEGLLS